MINKLRLNKQGELGEGRGKLGSLEVWVTPEEVRGYPGRDRAGDILRSFPLRVDA